MAIRRGTQTLAPVNLVPGAIILDNDTSNLTNTGRGTPSVVPEKKRQSQQWAVTDAGVTSNDGGHGITVLDINTVNSAFQGLAYTFPNDGTTDDNSWTIDVALPTFMSTTPNMKIRIFVQMPGPGAC